MAHWKRVIVDSRFMTRDSVSHSDFHVQLPYPITLPKGSELYCDAVSLSHSWANCIAGTNDRLYLRETVVNTPNDVYERIITLTPGVYNEATLRVELQAKLQTGTHLPGSYTVSLSNGRYVVANSCPVSQGWADLWVPTDEAYLRIAHPVFPGAWANELVGHLTNPLLADGTSRIHSAQSVLCTFLDLQPHKQVMIHAPGLGESTCLTLYGASDCIRRVLMGSSTQGEVVSDALNTTMAPVTFGSETVLSHLHFRICGWNGKLLDLAGHEISFELVIVRPDE